jgi:hypothetical protein
MVMHARNLRYLEGSSDRTIMSSRLAWAKVVMRPYLKNKKTKRVECVAQVESACLASVGLQVQYPALTTPPPAPNCIESINTFGRTGIFIIMNMSDFFF